jgi:hypothetical protein
MAGDGGWADIFYLFIGGPVGALMALEGLAGLVNQATHWEEARERKTDLGSALQPGRAAADLSASRCGPCAGVVLAP